MIFAVLSKSDKEKLLDKSIYYLRSITQNVGSLPKARYSN